MTRQPRAGLHPAIPGGLGAVCCLLACIPLAIAWFQFDRDDTADWKPTEAIITKSALYETEHRDKRDGTLRTVQSVDLAFSYAVAGHPYDGTRLDPSGFISWDAEEVVARWPVGARVEAWYDPLNPSDAALTRETSLSRYVLLGVGALLMALGTVFGVVATKLMR